MRRRRRNSKRRPLLLAFILLALFGSGGAFFWGRRSDRILAGEFARGKAQVERGEFERAVATFQSIYRHHPRFRLAPRALFQAGETLELNLKHPRKALLDFLLVVRDYPGSALAIRARRQIADIYKYRLMDYGKALLAYQKLLDSGAPDPDHIQYEIADTYFRRNNFEQARIEFESLLKNYPASPLAAEAAYRIAVAYSLDGDAAAAEKAFRRVFRLWPKNSFAAEARFGLATVLESQGELKKALSELEGLRTTYRDQQILTRRIARVKKRIRKKKLTY